MQVDPKDVQAAVALARDVVAAHAGGHLDNGQLKDVDLVFGRSVQLQAGVLDERAHDVFRNGQCHSLAIVLAARFGWQLAWVGEMDCGYGGECDEFVEQEGWCPCQLKHVGVIDDRGEFIDIDGAMTLEDVTRNATEQYGEAHAVFDMTRHQLQHILESADWKAPEITLAATFVEPLLARTAAERALAAGRQ